MINQQPKPKVIIFDADGVVVAPIVPFIDFAFEKFAINKEEAKSFFYGPFFDCLRGEKDLKTQLKIFLKEKNKGVVAYEFIKEWLEFYDKKDSRLVSEVEKLKEQGYLVCLATNQEKNRKKYMLEKMGFGELFDKCFFSCDFKAMKPDEDFYRSIESELRLKGKDILYFDDSKRFVKAAKEIGWNAVWYRGIGSYGQTKGNLKL